METVQTEKPQVPWLLACHSRGVKRPKIGRLSVVSTSEFTNDIGTSDLQEGLPR
jgi:hypothetical protein